MDAHLFGQIYMWGIVFGVVLGFSMALHIIAAIINGLKQGWINILILITSLVSKWWLFIIGAIILYWLH